MTKREYIKYLKNDIARCNALLNDEVVDGLKLGDAGLSFEWVTQTLVNLQNLLKEATSK